LAYATGSTGLAITVRGSSRRIMIMRFRPANIRLINRRSKLLRLLLALSSGKENANDQNNPTDLAQLTRSLHIRPTHSLSWFTPSVPFHQLTENLEKTIRKVLRADWVDPHPFDRLRTDLRPTAVGGIWGTRFLAGLLDVVVRCFAGDDDVVYVALT